MKILVVGGTFDNNGGSRSGLVDKFVNALMTMNGTVSYRNGGNYEELQYTLNNCVKNYDVVFWWANVPNDLPKVRDVKEVAPHVILVSSKRNDGDKYTFQELVNRALALKANLTFEFKKQDDGKFAMMVFDPLGSSWYEGTDINEAVKATVERLIFLMSITRNATHQCETGKSLVMSWYFDRFKQDMHQADNRRDIPEISDEEQFVNLVREYAEVFQSIMKPAKEVTRFLGNASMRPPVPPQVGRCGKGFPSFRKDGYIFVSKRNVDKQFITLDSFVPTFLDDGKVYYCGGDKPSVDTPIQLRLYKKLKNVNYMIHSHCYIKDAPFTSKCVPCGAIEEVDEIIKAIVENYTTEETNADCLDRYVLNLIGHGSIVMARDIKGLQGLEYYGRPMPEKMFGRQFKPKPVELTEHGKFLVNVSANFRESKQIYMQEPENESGNIKVSADENGIVCMYIPACDVIIQ